MNLDGIRVNHAAMNEVVERMRTAIRKNQQDLDNYYSALKGMAWSGQQRAAFEEAKRKWEEDMRQMNDILTRGEQNVVMSHDSYNAADRRGAANFQP